jgi:hypothetical protein
MLIRLVDSTPRNLRTAQNTGLRSALVLRTPYPITRNTIR